ncbi:MAG: alginate export family protein [Acidobacteriota bacterium]
MTRSVISVCVALAGLGLAWSVVPAAEEAAKDEEAASLAEAFTGGEVHGSFRWRFENVDDDAVPRSGQASTLRSTLSFRTKPFRGVGLFVEFEDVTDVGWSDDHANAGWQDLSNGVTDRPTIADPAVTQLNQGFLAFRRGGTELRVGRQEILFDNVRFVGNVGWRQNHQSFDAARLTTDAIPRTRLTLAWVRNVNQITGRRVDMGSLLANASVALAEGHAVTAYLYDLDYDTLVALSTRTLGLRYTGGAAVTDSGHLQWDLELADQQDSGDNPGPVDAGYRRAALTWKASRWSVGAGWEVLEGAPGSGAFRTPLATLHAWNGWADKFLATPPNGLVDLFVHVGGRLGDVSVKAVWHDFSSDSASIDYGTELDLVASWKASWGQTFAVKAALYDADAFSSNTTKLWVFTGWSF